MVCCLCVVIFDRAVQGHEGKKTMYSNICLRAGLLQVVKTDQFLGTQAQAPMFMGGGAALGYKPKYKGRTGLLRSALSEGSLVPLGQLLCLGWWRW